MGGKQCRACHSVCSKAWSTAGYQLRQVKSITWQWLNAKNWAIHQQDSAFKKSASTGWWVGLGVEVHSWQVRVRVGNSSLQPASEGEREEGVGLTTGEEEEGCQNRKTAVQFFSSCFSGMFLPVLFFMILLCVSSPAKSSARVVSGKMLKSGRIQCLNNLCFDVYSWFYIYLNVQALFVQCWILDAILDFLKETNTAFMYTYRCYSHSYADFLLLLCQYSFQWITHFRNYVQCYCTFSENTLNLEKLL